jgi:hypothetical protein
MVYFAAIWYIFHVLVYCTNKNLATLVQFGLRAACTEIQRKNTFAAVPAPFREVCTRKKGRIGSHYKAQAICGICPRRGKKQCHILLSYDVTVRQRWNWFMISVVAATNKKKRPTFFPQPGSNSMSDYISSVLGIVSFNVMSLGEFLSINVYMGR